MHLHLPWTIAYLSASTNVVGTAMIVRTVTQAGTGGFYTAPNRVPLGFPTNSPLNARIVFAATTLGTIVPAVVRLQLEWTQVRNNAIQAQGTIIHDVINVIAPFPVGVPLVVDLTGGAGSSWPANQFAVGDFLACRLARLGPDPADTADCTIGLASGLDIAP
jgi:hypothetical protein